jgi:ribulose-phosphate 3-epimerase
MSNKNSILITPSILNANFDDLESEIAKISQVSDLLHLDVMDNIFVPNFTFDFKRAKEIIDFSKLSVDAHLMIADPDDMAPKYAQVGCASVTFHYEAAKDSRIIIKNIKSNGAKAGIAIKPGTKFSQIEEFIDDIDMLLIMTVEPGFGGQSFMHDQMDKVAKARDRINQCKEPLPILQVDGGITLETIGEAASAGANCFVAGSAVYKSSNPADMVEQLRKIAVNSFKF